MMANGIRTTDAADKIGNSNNNQISWKTAGPGQTSTSAAPLSLTAVMSISSCGYYFAVTSLAGQLNVWDVRTSTLIAQYIPSTHLSSGCTKISWPPDLSKMDKPELNGSNKIEKRPSSSDNQNIENELKQLLLLAIGTENGTIFLFSVHRNEIYSVLDCGSKSSGNEQGHVSRVNDICWLPQNGTLFSCSDDDFIIEWNVLDGKVKSKSMLDRSMTTTSICALDEQNLLTASNLLKWWNWPRKQLLKTFNGHSTEVQFLRPITFFNKDNQQNETYIVSSAISDRYLYLWKLDDYQQQQSDSSKTLVKRSSSSNSLSSYLLDEEPISLEVSFTNSSNTLFIMSASKNGYFYFFKDNLNEVSLKSLSSGPMAPKFRLEIQTIINNSNNDSPQINGTDLPRKKRKISKIPRMVPCLYGHLEPNQLIQYTKDSNLKILLIYGIVSRPTFEQITLEECVKLCQKSRSQRKDEAILIKDSSEFNSLLDLLPKPSVINSLTENTKIKSAVQPTSSSLNNDKNKTTVIGPAGMVANQPLFNNLNGINGNDDKEDEKPLTNDTSNKKKTKKLTTEIEVVQEISELNIDKEKSDSQDKGEDEEMTMEEQLRSMAYGSANDQTTFEKNKITFMPSSALSQRHWKHSQNEPNKSDSGESLLNVLIQGLQSKDDQMLRSVLLEEHSDSLIVNTIKRLPIEFVPRLLVELEKGLCSGHHKFHWLYLKWITCLVKNKMSYLMTIPNISEEFLPLNQLLQARTAMLEKCYQLKGRLDLILSLIKTDFSSDKLSYQEPKLTYESCSSSSDEEDVDEEDQDSQMSFDDNDLIESDNSEIQLSDEEEDEEEDEELSDEKESADEVDTATTTDDQTKSIENVSRRKPLSSNNRKRKRTKQTDFDGDDDD